MSCGARPGRSVGATWRVAAVVTGVLTLASAGCGGTTRVATATPHATVVAASAADIADLEAAFVSYWSEPSTCPVTVRGPVRMATDASGTGWAVALMVPSGSCIGYQDRFYGQAPGPGPGGSYPTDISQGEPFSTGDPSVFMRKTGQAWVMDSLAGRPFPCPAPGGIAPGPGNGALPADVVAAFGLTYPNNCASVFYPYAPRD